MASAPVCPVALGKADTRATGQTGSDARHHAPERLFPQSRERSHGAGNSAPPSSDPLPLKRKLSRGISDLRVATRTGVFVAFHLEFPPVRPVPDSGRSTGNSTRSRLSHQRRRINLRIPSWCLHSTQAQPRRDLTGGNGLPHGAHLASVTMRSAIQDPRAATLSCGPAIVMVGSTAASAT